MTYGTAPMLSLNYNNSNSAAEVSTLSSDHVDGTAIESRAFSGKINSDARNRPTVAGHKFEEDRQKSRAGKQVSVNPERPTAADDKVQEGMQTSREAKQASPEPNQPTVAKDKVHEDRQNFRAVKQASPNLNGGPRQVVVHTPAVEKSQAIESLKEYLMHNNDPSYTHQQMERMYSDCIEALNHLSLKDRCAKLDENRNPMHGDTELAEEEQSKRLFGKLAQCLRNKQALLTKDTNKMQEVLPPVVTEAAAAEAELPTLEELPTVTEELPNVTEEIPNVTEELPPNLAEELPTIVEELPPAIRAPNNINWAPQYIQIPSFADGFSRGD